MCLELLIGTGYVTAAGCSKEPYSLAFKAIGLDKGVDDGGGSVPPYWESYVLMLRNMLLILYS